MTYLQTLAKKQDVTDSSIKSTKIGVFVDTSGSTSNRLGRTSVLDHEMIFSRIYQDMDTCICTWNTTASILYNDKVYVNPWRIEPDGGTSPECIIKNIQTKKIFDESNTIVFITDGLIDSEDVTKFAGLINEIIKNKTIICVLTCHDTNNPNISVFAPFLTTKDVIMLQYGGGFTAKILFSKGQFENSYPVNTNLSFEQLHEMKIINNMPNIRRNLWI